MLVLNTDAGVRLRDVTENDLPIFYEHQRDDEAYHMAAFTPREWDAFMSHWKAIIASDNLVKKTILFNEEVAGNIVAFGSENEREVGYWIGKEFWGKGIASAALAQFLECVPERPLHAHVAVTNVRSIRVLEKSGFIITAQQKAPLRDSEEMVDEYVMRLGEELTIFVQ